MSSFRENQKEQLRLALMRAGMSLIADRGFAQTTIEAITSAVGVSKGTFYTYFQAKEDLVLAALYHLGVEDPDHLKERLDASSNPREQVHIYFQTVCEWVQQNVELMWVATMEKLRRGATSEHGSARLRDVLAESLSRGQQAGKVTKVRAPKDMAIDLEGIFMIHYARWYHGGAKGDLTAIVLPAVDLYLSGALEEDDQRG